MQGLRRFLAFGVAASAMLVSGCTQFEEPNLAMCGNAQISWTVSKAWRLVVLDDAVDVRPGNEFVAKSKPYNTRIAIAVTSAEALSQRTIFEGLSRHLKKELADPNRSTASEAREMSASLRDGGKVVYYRGVKGIDAAFTYTCPGASEKISGTVFTWEVKSSTTGLVDCLAKPEENSRSQLARMAISRRCLEGSPAREVLGE